MLTHHVVSLPHGRNLGARGSLWALSRAALGERRCGGSETILLTLFSDSSCCCCFFSLFPQHCAITSPLDSRTPQKYSRLRVVIKLSIMCVCRAHSKVKTSYCATLQTSLKISHYEKHKCLDAYMLWI